MTKILQFRIYLEGVTPKIWRQFQVRSDISFHDLHNTIQIVMGWEDYHMYEFLVDKEIITSDEEGFNPAEGMFKQLFNSPEFFKMVENANLRKGSASLDVNKLNKILKDSEKNKIKPKYDMDAKISELIRLERQKFTYNYDFGDNWKHSLILEKISAIEDFQKLAVCLDGELACPPEDCGGIEGYYELIKIKKNKKHPQYKERIVEWLGENFDFEQFDIDLVNKELKNIVRSKMEKIEDFEKNEEDDLWEEGYFAETMGPKDIKERMRTFHMKHDEEMNYNCKKCNKKISAHNKDWHNGMCDDCFNKEYHSN